MKTLSNCVRFYFQMVCFMFFDKSKYVDFVIYLIYFYLHFYTLKKILFNFLKK